MKYARIALLTGMALCLVPCHAQITRIGNVSVSCQDATGQAVTIILDPSLANDLAESTINRYGVRLIRLNATSFPREPVLLQYFIFAHECGHHMSGDVVAGVVFHHDNPAREMVADRIGIRILRDQLSISLQQAQAIAVSFRDNPPRPPYYLPGPQRAKWIIDCYRSDNDSCNSTAKYGLTTPHVPSHDVEPDNPGANESAFCSKLSEAMKLSPSYFHSVRGLKDKDIDDAWATSFKFPGFSETCDLIQVKGLSGSLSCYTDSDYATLKSIVSSCLKNWPTDTWRDSHDKMFRRTLFKKDGVSTLVWVVEAKSGASVEISDPCLSNCTPKDDPQ